ncbi:MAG: Fur family transcriptional regulator [Chloroflexota bacterium]
MDSNPEKPLLIALRSAGLRITPQRAAICRLLAATEAHPTAQAIYDDLLPHYPGLSLATVYNTLDALVQVGAVNSLGSLGDDAVHYDADTAPHVNLACLVCHQVVDYPSDHIRQVNTEVQSTSGYRLLGARVLYYGICPDCQERTFSEDFTDDDPTALT